ncbi:WD repeat-containing protein 44 [Linum perenne]
MESSLSDWPGGVDFDIWTNNLDSVEDRRRRFLGWMNLSSDTSPSMADSEVESAQLGVEIDNRVMDDSGAELRTCDSEEGGFWSDTLSRSTSCHSAEAREWFDQEDASASSSEANFLYKIRNLDDEREFVVEELDQDGIFGRLREVGSDHSLSFEEFQRSIGWSPLIQRLCRRYADEARNNLTKKARKKPKKSWLRNKLGTPGRNSDKREYKNNATSIEPSFPGTKMQKVKVHTHRKKTKQLSSLYAGQDFVAHKGSILTMKFSLDGQYLASGGEDGIVRVWKVIEEDRLDQFDVPSSDPSCLYFAVDNRSNVTSIDVEEAAKRHHISSDSTCVVLPEKVFRVLEKPLHEFKGHIGEVLDLSWSKKEYLLSSSDDNTVRLWKVGCDKCLKVFHHSNYVTCIQFNPVDEDYFISGSVDGKVRVWEVPGCQVISYTDVTEIITAIAYRPGGEGAIVGTMSGNCLFYEITDNKMRHDTVICLQGKTKLPGKRITGVEFSPSDPSKVIVTSADSLVRVLCSTDVICKFRVSRLQIATNQMHATFTSDGKNVVSMSDDSNVYIWNYDKQEKPSSRAKYIRSYESFISQNASVAIPWRGIKTMPGTILSPRPPSNGYVHSTCSNIGHNHHNKSFISSPDCFPINRGFLLDSLSRGAATWPEETLPDSKPVSLPTTPKLRSELKFLKNACHSMFNSQMWGMVVVTAGWDGRIRTYLNYGLPLRV